MGLLLILGGNFLHAQSSSVSNGLKIDFDVLVDKPSISFSQPTFKDGNQNAYLENNEQGFIEFTVSNSGEAEANNLVFSIKVAQVDSAIDVQESYTIETLKVGEEKFIQISILGLKGITNGKADISIVPQKRVGISSQNLTLSVNTKKKIFAPTLRWQSLARGDATSEEKFTTVSACVSSEADLQAISLYVNNEVVQDQLNEFFIQNTSACDFLISSEIPLAGGGNEVLLEVENEGGKSTSETLKITYNRKPDINFSQDQLDLIENQIRAQLDKYFEHFKLVADINEPSSDREYYKQSLISDVFSKNKGVQVFNDLDPNFSTSRDISIEKYLNDLSILYPKTGVNAEFSNIRVGKPERNYYDNYQVTASFEVQMEGEHNTNKTLHVSEEREVYFDIKFNKNNLPEQITIVGIQPPALNDEQKIKFNSAITKGDTYLEVNSYVKAIEQYKIALQLKPNDEATERKLKKAERLAKK